MPSFNDFYFNSSTGKNRIHVRRCVPDGQVRAVVQIMHGIAEHIAAMMILWRFLRLTVSLPSAQTISATVRALKSPSRWAFSPRKTVGIIS